MKKKLLIMLTCLMSICLLGLFTACNQTSEPESGSTPPSKYTVTFVDYDDEIISTASYEEGATVEVPQAPTRDADLTYTYAFAGWDKEVVKVDGDATYKATYTPTYIDYTVAFLDENGEELQSETYHYGDALTAPQLPNDSEDETYTYSYGWDTEVPATVQGNATFNRVLNRTYIDYVVKFLNADGSDFEVQTYHYGDAIVEPTENPTKDADNTYTYAFAGWGEVAETVTAQGLTYTATFTPEYINYSVVFVDDDGTEILRKDDYHYGDTVVEPSEDPSKAPNVLYSYTFDGWDAEVETVAGNVTYTAVYSEIIKTGFSANNTTANGDTIVLGKGTIGSGASYKKGAQEDDEDGEPSYVHQAYLAIDGNYGLNDYVAFDFTGKNMPEVAFFAENYDDSMYANERTKQGIVVYTGITNYDGTEIVQLHSGKTPGTYVNYGHPFMIQNASANDFTQNGCPESQLGRANLVDGTHYRVIMGFVAGSGHGSNGITLHWYLYNLDTEEVVEQSSLGTWNFFTGSNDAVGNMTLNDLVGSIVLYGKFGTTCTIDKLHGVFEDTTIDFIKLGLETGAFYKGVNATLNGDVLTLGSGNIGAGANYTKGQNAGGSITQAYFAIDGEYGLDNYVVLDFTGKNMPEIMFFAQNYDTSMYYSAGKQGMVVASGITLYNGTVGSAQSNNTKIGMSGPFGAYFEGAAEPHGGNMFGDTDSKLARANLIDGTHYRVVIGVAKSSNLITLKYWLYDLDNKALVEEKSIDAWDFFTGSNPAVGNMTLNNLVGSIVLYGKFGTTCTIDKLHGVESGNFADIVAKYTPQA